MIKLFIVFGFTTNVAFGQAPVIEWQKCYGGSNFDDGWTAQMTTDRGFFLFGNTRSNDGNVIGYHDGEDLWCVKTDSIGNIQWQKCLGGTDDEFGARSIQTSDGGYLVSGLTYSNDGDVSGNHGFADTWLVKLNFSGGIMWQKCYGGSNFDGGPYQLIETAHHTYIICANTYSSDFDVFGNHGSNTSDIWIFEIDSSGTLLWQKCIGGSQYDYESCLLEVDRGGYILLGKTNSSDGDIVTSSYGGYDFWFCKLDSAFNIIWQRSYGGSADDIARSARQARDGGFVIGGSTASDDFDVSGNHSLFGSQDYWLIKVDSMGDLQWQKCLGGTMWEDAFSIDTTLDDGILIAGISYSEDGDITSAVDSLSSNWWIVNLDNSGNILWDKSLGGTGQEEAQAISTTIDGGCIILGYTDSYDLDVSGGGNHGGQDIWAVKLSPLTDGISSLQNTIRDFTTYLNPSTNTLTVNFYANGNEKVQLQLLDITGRKLLQQGLVVQEGFNKKEVRTGEMAAGVYIVRLVIEGGSVSKKLMVH